MTTATGNVATAFLLIDVQEQIVSFYPDAERVLDVLSRALEFARDAGLPVVHVGVQFRAGYPELSPSNRLLGPLAASQAFEAGQPGVAFHEKTAPRPGEFVVVKRRVSAFAGTDLQTLLVPLEVRRLIITGISTSGAVLSTVRQAADLDYDCTVLSDCCVEGDPAVHAFVLDRVIAMQANVCDSEQWISASSATDRG